MSEQVVAFRTRDGWLYDSKDGADKHELALGLLEIITGQENSWPIALCLAANRDKVLKLLQK